MRWRACTAFCASRRLRRQVIRISFVKGVTAKVQDTYWKPKADTSFPWSAKESKTAVLVETEKLRVMVEKKDGAVQFFTPDHKLVLSEKRDEPRMIDGGMTWTFFDWSGSEKLKAKGILSTEWLDLTAKARYVSFGGKQARMPLASQTAAMVLQPPLPERHCCAMCGRLERIFIPPGTDRSIITLSSTERPG